MMESFRCPAVEWMTMYCRVSASWLTRSLSHGVMLSLMSVRVYFPVLSFLSTRMEKLFILPET